MAHIPMVRSTSKPYTPPSAMCSSCSTTDIDCSEPLCSPSNELTAQCTDQCVVIACSDPNHEESICDRDGAHAHCHFVCDDAVDCTDCHGFDAFLRCCGDFRQYNPEPPRPAPQATTGPMIVWDATFENLWCPCEHQLVEIPKPIALERPMDSYAHPNMSGGRDVNSFPTRATYASEPDSHQTTNAFSRSSPPVPSEPVNCMWDSCQDTFPSISELAGHVSTHIPSYNDDSFYQSFNQSISQNHLACLWAECDSSYYSSPNDFELLANHVLNDHLGVSPPSRPCASSSRLTSPPLSSSDMSQSVPIPEDDSMTLSKSPSPTSTTTATTTKQHSCNEINVCRWKDCGEIFNSCDDLTAHITSLHIGGGKAHYECYWDQCTRNGSQGFQSKQKICRHVQAALKSHTGHRPFQCTICQQNFSEAATLQQHIRRHTQEKPYMCDHPGCGKSFAITGALTIHKRTHNGDKPFKCSFCERGFAESSNLSKHLRTHTGARPYTCTEPGCNKSFARPDQLNRHKGVHKKQIRGITRTSLE